MNNINLPQKLKLPSHVMEFRCAQCGECCTSKWQIEVDDVSYEKLYKKFEELGRHEELYDNVKYHNVAPQIRFLPNGKCPYLSADNRCSIQLEIGEKYLLDICKVYPRRIFASQHAIEFALSLTCRTAVKTLLQEQIRVFEIDLPMQDGQSVPFSFMQPNTISRYFPDQSAMGDLQLPYYVLENRFIELLQDRRYSVSQRLVGLGQVLGGLHSENISQGSEITSQSLQSIHSNNHCYDVEPDLERNLSQFFLISNIFIRKAPLVIWSQILRSILLTLSSGKPHPVETGEIVHSKVPPPHPGDYQQKLDQYYRPTCGMVEHILENFMVNFILSKCFYLQPVHLAYYRMAFLYAAITGFSLGYCILTDQPVNQETTLQAIYDVENIFYADWFYPFAAALHAGKDYQQIIGGGMSLASI